MSDQEDTMSHTKGRGQGKRPENEAEIEARTGDKAERKEERFLETTIDQAITTEMNAMADLLRSKERDKNGVDSIHLLNQHGITSLISQTAV